MLLIQNIGAPICITLSYLHAMFDINTYWVCHLIHTVHEITPTSSIAKSMSTIVVITLSEI